MQVSSNTQSVRGSAADSTAHADVVVELRGVTKSYGPTIAAHDVSLQLRAGEVLALIGENGAGKSTCVKVLGGVVAPDEGSVHLDGQPVRLGSPQEAHDRGIAVVHQHPGLFPDLSVAENVFAGQLPRRRGGLVDHRHLRREAERLLALLGLDRPSDTPLRALRTSEQQLVEIARALAAEARVLIMDEPTAALSSREVDRLFTVVERLREHNVAMMFVGHRLEEIFRISDRLTIMRDGGVVAESRTAEMTPAAAVQRMVGRELADLFPERRHAPGSQLLDVRGLTRAGEYADVSLRVCRGEILGLAGLVGSGRTEIARTLFGITRPDAGTITLDGVPLTLRSAADALDAGVAYVSEDRRGQSLVMDFGVLANATLPTIERARRRGLVRRDAELNLVHQALADMQLRFRSYDQPVKTLSGGNQQKVVLAKWLAARPSLLILDEPTQGIDVQAKVEVHRAMAALADEGLGIILISSDMPELLGMCDRVVVMREGVATAHLDRDEMGEDAIAVAATGAPAEGEQPDGEARPTAAVEAGSEPPVSDQFTQEAPAWRRALARRELGLVAAILAVAVPVSAINARFLTEANLVAILTDCGLLAIVAVGQMLVLLTRNIDLSVASIIGLSAYVSADTIAAHPGISVPGAIGVACAVGIACGLANGLVVAMGRVPAIVVTLGTLTIFRGMTSQIAGSSQVSADQVPGAWLDLTSARLLGLPSVVYFALAVLVLAALGLRFTVLGRELFAVGSNPDGAALIGVRVRRRVLAAFVLSGLLAGFAGALWASRYATIDARAAINVEFTVIASVVVGGVALFGGSGTVLGVALGTLLLLVIQNGLQLVRVDPLWLQAVYGGVIVLTIALDAFVRRRSPTRKAAAP